jgi:hypothetical protein
MEGRHAPDMCRDRDGVDGRPETVSWEHVIDSGVLDWIWAGELAEHGYRDHELAILARVLARRCPHCEAKPGQWCRNTGSGTLLDHIDKQHVARRMHI